MMRMEMVLETLACLLLNRLMCLVVRGSFIVFRRVFMQHMAGKYSNGHVDSMSILEPVQHYGCVS